ncbi:hypothetical protein SP_1150 [Streptococcus pneumoniae TIGR4]|uniref:Uncharacterized protein n=1 Tax=Streptococcus pneumoniae serotype 4 (strain ATCC BAA-334 / TIGR4) TaxID=170187 RepID=A0A0H2UQ25_STRPN|nr:hypothetical protein SP_1150 [Streptococcus pneumoniae TIGR4]
MEFFITLYYTMISLVNLLKYLGHPFFSSSSAKS